MQMLAAQHVDKMRVDSQVRIFTHGMPSSAAGANSANPSGQCWGCTVQRGGEILVEIHEAVLARGPFAMVCLCVAVCERAQVCVYLSVYLCFSPSFLPSFRPSIYVCVVSTHENAQLHTHTHTHTQVLLTLGHELVHAQQMLDTRANDSSGLREFEAFSWSLFVFDSTDVCERIRGR